MPKGKARYVSPASGGWATTENPNKKNDRSISLWFKTDENGNKVLSCPKCGGLMKYRESKYGPFLGCGNFPKCYYKINDSETVEKYKD